MISRRLLIRIAPFWILFILIGSFIPGKDKELIGTYTPFDDAVEGKVQLHHRLAHFAVFGATGLLLMLIARRPKSRALMCLATIAFGIAIELGQWRVFRLGLELWDVRDDTLAALAAYGLASISRVRAVLVSD